MHNPAALLTLLSLASLSTAHFLLDYPPTVGFSDDNESTSPCSGFDPIVNSSSTSIPVDSFPLQLTSTHPQANWLFRATTDTKAPFNWTNLLPVVSEQGLGAFCLPNLKIPASFAGKGGVIQIVQGAADGALYQVT
jgi:hypothetical protein